MLTKTLPLAMLLLCTSLFATAKTDPNHTASGGYGYLISKTPETSVWWAEGAYKVMQDAPVPTKKKATIRLESAKNEWESFILVVNPEQPLRNLQIKLSPLSTNGTEIPTSDIVVRKVEYVTVTHPTDQYGFAGKWPDPLPLYKGGENLNAGINQPFWISVKTPANAAAGLYKANLSLTADGYSQQIPVELNVWNFALPDTTTMRSGFGFNLDNVAKYNNLTTEAEKQKAFDLHMKAFADYKVSPYSPFERTPIHETVTGVDWKGGFFDSKEKHSGKYAYMVVDKSYTENTEASLRSLQPVQGGKAYNLQWWAKSKEADQPFVIGVECYDKNDSLIWFENRYEEFRASNEWKSYSLPLGNLTPETASIMIRLYPSKRTAIGEGHGTVWFDDFVLSTTDKGEAAKAWTQGDNGVATADNSAANNKETTENLLTSGGFEVDVNKIDIQLDFTDFNKAAKKYFDEYGFNGHRLQLKGLGGGTYFSSEGGVFEGFAQGTEEYDRLMERYLKQIEANLVATGMIGKEYIYWFDEPNESNYPFIYETHKMLKKHAPKLTTFLTEHIAGQDISDVTDISCTIWHKLDHEKAKKMHEKGQEYWSYLCCWPKSPWISEFIDHDAVNFRMWIWASYVHHLKGILVWESTYWNSPEASPIGKLQNPWQEAMSWVTGYGWVQGKQTVWGNGDGRMFYPENRDVNNDKHVYNNEAVPSVRLETLRDGIEDYEYMMKLEQLIQEAPKSKASQVAKAKKLLSIPKSIYTDEQTYNKDPQAILQYRKKLAEAILSLQK
ncbi:MAG: glycoside hydrolase domain-containing protein [Tannerellaceae bacterium]